VQLSNPAQDRARNETIARLSGEEVERLVIQFQRAFERQSQFDAEIAASLVRILRGEARGVAREPADEARKLFKQIVRERLPTVAAVERQSERNR